MAIFDGAQVTADIPEEALIRPIKMGIIGSAKSIN
jgi:hypothetical protein